MLAQGPQGLNLLLLLPTTFPGMLMWKDLLGFDTMKVNQQRTAKPFDFENYLARTFLLAYGAGTQV